MPEDAKQKNKSGRWLWLLATLLAIIALVLLLLPLAIEWGAEKWLRENGAAQAEVADVDLNLFTGQLAVYGLAAGTAEGRAFKVAEARLEVNWQALFKQRIELERIELMDAVIDVRPLPDQNAWAVGELRFVTGAASDDAEPESRSDWGVGINTVVVNAVVINHLAPQLNNHLQIKQLQLDQLASWLKDKPAKLTAELRVNEATFHIDSELLPFKQRPQISANLRLSALNLKNYAVLIEAAGLLQPAGNVSVDLSLKLDYHNDSELNLNLEGSVALADFYAELDDIVIKQKALRWQGQINALVNLNDPAAPSLKTQGDATLKALNVDDEKSGLTLLDLEHVEFKGIKVTELDNISLAAVNLLQLQALKKTKTTDRATFLTLEKLALNGIALTKMNHAVINEIKLEQLAVDVAIAEDGKVALLDDLAPSSSKPNKTDTAHSADDEKTAFTFEIGQLNITDNSSIKFADDSVVPAYQMNVAPFELTLKNINSAEPQQAAELDLNAGLGKYASFSLAGTVQAFDEKITAQLKGGLKSLDLPPLSSYAGKYMGYHLQRGRLSTRLDIKIVNDELDINNTLLLSKLLVEEMDDEAAKGFAEKLGMPLNAALGLLRDGDDNIEFDLPVTGNLNDPNFELSGVMKLALSKGMQMAAMSYIKNALQPLGTIMLVSDIVGKVTALRFQPLLFDAGSAELNDEGRVYLDKIARVLNERPNIQLTLCGVSTLVDQQLVDTQMQAAQEEGEGGKKPEPVDIKASLLELATQRGEGVKNYFITQKNIDPERLFSCNSRFTQEDDSVPSVDITL